MEDWFFPFCFIRLLNLGHRDSDLDITLLASAPIAEPEALQLHLVPMLVVCLNTEEFGAFSVMAAPDDLVCPSTCLQGMSMQSILRWD